MNYRCTLASLLLLAFLTGASIWGRWYVADTCKTAQNTIAKAEQLSETKDYAEIREALADLCDILDKRRPMLHVLLHHSYVESVMAALRRAVLAAEFENTETLRTELSTAAMALDALAERDRLTAGNVF